MSFTNHAEKQYDECVCHFAQGSQVPISYKLIGNLQRYTDKQRVPALSGKALHCDSET